MRRLLSRTSRIGALCFLLLSNAFMLNAQEADAPLRRVSGVVLDENQAPIVGVNVSLYTRSPTDALTTLTAGDGSFSFETPLTRSVTLTASAQGFASITRKIDTSEANLTLLMLVLTPATVEERVTITATRTETRLEDTAASITTLSAAELSTTGALTIDDALRQIPGFQLFRRSGSRTANPTAQGISLRGVGASGASRALIFADGIPLNDPFGGWVYWGRVPRESLSRIEVLRGGASDLYGSGALGGVVNLLTRRAEASPVLSLEASYGNLQTPDASLFMSGRKGRWGASLAAETFNTDGYIIVAEDERGRVDTPAASRRAAIDLKLDYEAGEDARIFFGASYYGEARENGTPMQINRTHIRQLSAGGDWQAESVGAISARFYLGTQVYDQTFSAVASDRNSETLTRLQRVPSQVAGLTVQWSRAIGSRHTLIAGLDAREVRGASDEIAFVQSLPNTLVGAGGRERSFGIFFKDIVRVTSRLLVTGGARFDRWRNYAAQSATQSVRPGGTSAINVFPDRSETAFSPQLSALYKLSEEVSLTASAYRAFRAPTLNELYRSFRVGDALTLANEDLRAERLTGGEAGSSVNLLKRKLYLRGTFFWTEITRPIANVTLSVTPNLITRERQNLGRTRSRGMEMEAEMRFAGYWLISGGYLFVDATVIEFPANAALEGLLIPQIPRHNVTFQVRYANPSKIQFGLQGRAASAQFDDDLNCFRLGRYFTLDAHTSRRLTSEFEIFASFENIFNQRYAVGSTPVTTVGTPFLFRAGFRLRLGKDNR